MSQQNEFDVAILGSGLAGTTLAAILARQGVSTLLLESGTHPRLAVGESVVPEFGARARIISEAFDVPDFVDVLDGEFAFFGLLLVCLFHGDLLVRSFGLL